MLVIPRVRTRTSRIIILLANIIFANLFHISPSWSTASTVEALNPTIVLSELKQTKRAAAAGGWKTGSQDSESYYIDALVPDAKYIVNQLTSRTDWDTQTLHLFSHGRSGELLIEGEWKNAVQIIDWLRENNRLDGKTAVNIYGCEFAQSEKGLASVAYLEYELDITVAASTDITGKNGDWDLEIGSNTFSSLSMPGYQYNLQDIVATFTGNDQVITAPTNAIGMQVKIWGAGGGHEFVETNGLLEAGAGGYTSAEFGSDVVSAGTQFTLVVGEGGNNTIRPPDGSHIGVYGFGGEGTHDQGGGLSGIFTGNTTVMASDQARALAVAGGGGGADDDSQMATGGGTNGNGPNSGGQPDMMGSTDDFPPCGFSSFYPDNFYSSGGGGYEGGARSNFGANGGPGTGGCMISVAGSQGGSGFVAASATSSSIEFTADGVNAPPNTGDSDYIAGVGVSGTVASTAGGNGLIIVTWIIVVPELTTTKSSSPVDGSLVVPGQTVTYTVTVENTGTLDLTGVTVDDVLPSGVAYDAQSTVASGPIVSTITEDFETGVGGWVNSGGCTTGQFVSVDPFATSYQLDDDHTVAPGVNALISGQNTSLGAGDVDGGSCISTSPVYAVSGAGTASIWYFHGQRDNGDDAADGFLLEVSTDSGGSFSNLVQIGDVTTNPAWTQANATIPAGATGVQFRVTATDGTGNGDIIEAGVDDIEIITSSSVIKDNIPGGANSDLTNGIPPSLVVAADSFQLAPGETITVTYDVTVDAGATGDLINNATADSIESGPDSGTVTLTVADPPVANDDFSSGNPPGSNASVNIITGFGADDPAASADTLTDGNTATAAEVTVDLDSASVTGGSCTSVPTSPCTRVSVAGEGIWTYNPANGNLLFNPIAAFTGDPQPLDYTLTEIATDLTDTATVTVDYDPIATDDSSLGNTPGAAVLIDVVANDTTGDSIDPTTVSLVDPGGAINIVTDANGDITSMDIPGQGTWSVNPTTGVITFTPLPGFTQDPTPVDYNVEDDEGNQSNDAAVTIDYVPIAMADTAEYVPDNPSPPIDVLANDILGDSVDPTTVSLVNPGTGTNIVTDANGDIISMDIPGEGTWSVDPGTGAVTFTPQAGFTGDPSINYTVEDDEGNESNQATITLTANDVPVAEDDTISAPVTSTDSMTLDVLSDNGNGADDSGLDGYNSTTPLQLIDPGTGNPVPTGTPVTTAQGGSVVITDPNNTPDDPTDDVVTYTPPDTGGTTVSDSFEYEICDNSVPADCDTATVTISNVTTPVTLRSFYSQADASGMETVVGWTTSTETGNLGFNLYIERQGKLHRLNRDLIKSQVIHSVETQSYRVSITGLRGRTLVLADVDIYGNETKHGPFKVGKHYGHHSRAKKTDWEKVRSQHELKKQQRALRKQERLKMKLERRLQREMDREERIMRQQMRQQEKANGATKDLSDTGTSGWLGHTIVALMSAFMGTAHGMEVVNGQDLLQIKVNESGIYRVTYEEMKGIGLDLAGTGKGRIAFTHRGKAFPISIIGSHADRRFMGPGGYIQFIGEGIDDSLYTRDNVYVVRLDRSLAARHTFEQWKVPAGDPVPFYMATEHMELDLRYSFSSPTADPWYWGPILADSEPVSVPIQFELDEFDATAGKSPLVSIGAYGGTDFPVSPDHHLVVKANNTVILDEYFEGLVALSNTDGDTFDVELNPGILNTSNNVMEFELPHDTGAAADLVNMNHFSVTYPRRFVAVDDELTFTSSGHVFEVINFTRKPTNVFRIRAGGRVDIPKKEISRYTDENGAQKYKVRFRGLVDGKEAHYIVSSISALKQASLTAIDEEDDITVGDAQYLVITHPDFSGPSLDLLINHRAGQFDSIKRVEVEQIYAQFNHYITDAQAIKDYIAHAYKKMGTRYVLLVGGDTHDPFGHLNYSNNVMPLSFIPSLYVQTDNIVRYAPSDPKYADINNDNIPELSIGRIPVRTEQELSILVDKIMLYEQKHYPRTAVFAADIVDPQSQYNFAVDADTLIEALPTSWQDGVQTAYIDAAGVGEARASLLTSINNGVALTNFIGHSGPKEWTFSGLFAGGDAQTLTNQDLPTVVSQWGCWNTYYTSPTEDTLGHEWLLNGNKGAAAVMGATTLSYASGERLLAQEMLPKLVRPGMPIGKAILRAKRNLAQTYPEKLDLLLGWTLLGDPGMVID